MTNNVTDLILNWYLELVCRLIDLSQTVPFNASNSQITYPPPENMIVELAVSWLLSFTKSSRPTRQMISRFRLRAALREVASAGLSPRSSELVFMRADPWIKPASAA
jgi:hypothetical protein